MYTLQFHLSNLQTTCNTQYIANAKQIFVLLHLGGNKGEEKKVFLDAEVSCTYHMSAAKAVL